MGDDRRDGVSRRGASVRLDDTAEAPGRDNTVSPDEDANGSASLGAESAEPTNASDAFEGEPGGLGAELPVAQDPNQIAAPRQWGAAGAKNIEADYDPPDSRDGQLSEYMVAPSLDSRETVRSSVDPRDQLRPTDDSVAPRDEDRDGARPIAPAGQHEIVVEYPNNATDDRRGAATLYKEAPTSPLGSRSELDHPEWPNVRARLRVAVDEAIDIEGPIELTRLTRNIVRRFGFNRAKSQRQDLVVSLCRMTAFIGTNSGRSSGRAILIA